MLQIHTPKRALALLLGLALAWAAAPAASAQAPSGEATRPNLLLVTIDTWRWDYLSATGSKKVETPSLDALAARGALFTDTRVTAPITLVSHASLFTGTLPTTHGVHHNGSFVLGEEQTTLAEALAAAGYRTGAVTAAYVVSSRYGLAQGFETYQDVVPESLYGEAGLQAFYPELDAEAVTDRALAAVRGFKADKPWFLWVHYFDAHAPYQAPEPWAGRYPKDPYAAEVAFVDHQLGRLLAAVEGGKRETAVVVTTDHGESLGEHGEATHGHFVYEATMRVPAIVSLPAGPRAARFDQTVRSIDLMPTVLEALGVAVPQSVQGTSLSALWQDRGRRQAVYAETFLPYYDYGWAYLRSLVLDGWKYVHGPAPELYDLRADPAEAKNLLAAQPERAASMRSTLDRLVSQTAGTSAATSRPAEAETAALASLGYVGGGANPPPAETDAELASLPDPKSRIHLEREIAKAWADQGNGNVPGALKRLDKVLAEDPHNTAALRFGAVLARELGQWERSIAYLARLASQWPAEGWRVEHATARKLQSEGDSSGAARRYAKLLRACGSPSALEVEMCLASLSDLVHLQLDGGDAARARLTLRDNRLGELKAATASDRLRHANLYVSAALHDEAERLLRGVRADFPALPDPPLALGNLYRDTGRPKLAIQAFEAALAVDPGFVHALNNLATLHGQLGNLPASDGYLERVLALAPDNSRALGNLALNRYLQGDPEESIRLFEKAVKLDSTNVAARLNFARVLLQRKQVDRAVRLCREVVAVDPDNAVARQVLAQVKG